MDTRFNYLPAPEEASEHIYLKLPGIPPSLNKLLGANRFYIHRVKKNWEAIVEEYAPLKPHEPMKRAIIYYVFHFRTKRRQDPDNMASAVKFINDGLVNAGFLVDDAFDNVDIRIRRGEKSPSGEYTEVIIIDPDDVAQK